MNPINNFFQKSEPLLLDCPADFEVFFCDRALKDQFVLVSTALSNRIFQLSSIVTRTLEDNRLAPTTQRYLFIDMLGKVYNQSS